MRGMPQDKKQLNRFSGWSGSRDAWFQFLHCEMGC